LRTASRPGATRRNQRLALPAITTPRLSASRRASGIMPSG
jgi:hypothetical protein